MLIGDRGIAIFRYKNNQWERRWTHNSPRESYWTRILGSADETGSVIVGTGSDQSLYGSGDEASFRLPFSPPNARHRSLIICGHTNSAGEEAKNYNQDAWATESLQQEEDQQSLVEGVDMLQKAVYPRQYVAARQGGQILQAPDG
ncbi:hypothetical protein ACP70R_000936 [Stipagrostis hirtigluma subsp. patula]